MTASAWDSASRGAGRKEDRAMEVAVAVAASAGRLNKPKLLAHAKSKEIAALMEDQRRV
jgi:hypothetical protein